jgi:hypothetical protein
MIASVLNCLSSVALARRIGRVTGLATVSAMARQGIVLSALVLAALSAAPSAKALERDGSDWFPRKERLEYTVSYKGVFSAWARVEIATAAISTELDPDPLNGHPVYRSEVWVTTELYRKTELLYPFRFRYQSWFSLDPPRTELVAVWQKARNGVERGVLWFDWEGGGIRRFTWEEQSEGTGKTEKTPVLPDYLADRRFSGIALKRFRYRGQAALTLAVEAMDYLALLQHVRFRDLRPVQTLYVPVSDGKDLLGYRIQVQARERLSRNDSSIEAFKLRFDPLYQDGDSHPDIYLWISADQRRLPLRSYSEHALYGAVEVNLRQ